MPYIAHFQNYPEKYVSYTHTITSDPIHYVAMLWRLGGTPTSPAVFFPPSSLIVSPPPEKAVGERPVRSGEGGGGALLVHLVAAALGKERCRRVRSEGSFSGRGKSGCLVGVVLVAQGRWPSRGGSGPGRRLAMGAQLASVGWLASIWIWPSWVRRPAVGWRW